MPQMRGYDHRTDQACQPVCRLSSQAEMGGKVGGKRRLETLSDRRRSQIVKNVAKARWSTKKKPAA